MGTRVYFLSPGNKAGAEIIKEILSTLKSATTVKICVAYFTHPKISKAILERRKAGKQTKIILNAHDLLRPSPTSKNTTEIVIAPAMVEIFKNLGSSRFGHPIGGDSDDPESLLSVRLLRANAEVKHSHMHHKFILADKGLLGFGSMNFTRNALENNHEDFTITDDRKLMSAFNARFDELWDQGESFITQAGKFRILKCPECKTPEGIDFESYGAFCINCGHTFKARD